MSEQARTLPLFDDRPMVADDPDDTRHLPPAGDGPKEAATIQPPPPPVGAGPLVHHAWPLLALLARLASGATPVDPERLKSEAAELVRGFERTALAAGTEPRLISAARYTLCTAIDEAVSIADPAAANLWARGTLLSLFHNETWGGEKVFSLIDRTLAQPDRYGDLLELCHMVLVLGFQGKYRLERDGTAKVDALRGRLFDALQPRFGERPAFPAPGQHMTGRQRARLIHYVPVWTVAVVCLLISAILFAWLDYRVKTAAHSVAAAISQVSGLSAQGPAE